MGYQGTVTHVRLLQLVTWGDTYQLRHQAVHHIGIILRLIRLFIRHQAQLYQFLVGNIVQSEQVGSRLLYRTAVGLQRIGINAWQQLSATMT